MSLCKFFDFKNLGDDRGSLVAIDYLTGLPFDIKRAYYIFDTKPEIIRGQHAHKKLHQVAICLAGSCTMLLDNGIKKEEVTLNNPNLGINIPPMLWHEMYNFTSDSILLVLADDYYLEDDYIRNYEEYKTMINT